MTIIIYLVIIFVISIVVVVIVITKYHTLLLSLLLLSLSLLLSSPSLYCYYLITWFVSAISILYGARRKPRGLFLALKGPEIFRAPRQILKSKPVEY